MEIAGTEVPIVVVAIGAVALLIVIAALVDLSRHEVQHMPRWAWVLVICLASVPIGAIAYFAFGRKVGEGEPPGNTDLLPAWAIPPAPTAGPEPAGPEPAGPEPAGPEPAGPEPAGPDPVPKAAVDPTDVVVATHALRKVYGEHAALDGVDLAVPRGATYGLIGPNGAGKTTMLSILAGLRRPTEGTVDLGVPRSAVGVLVDTPLFEPWLTAREVVDLARTLTNPGLPHSRVEEVLTQVGLAEAMDRRVRGFSRGMLQRLGLAGCLVGDPEVLLLDEPSSALDPAGRREVLDLVGRLAQTTTVILSTHILADVQQVADVVGVIDRGQLRFQGPLEDLLARSAAVFTLHLRTATATVAEALRAEPWVREVTAPAPGRLRVVATDARQAEQRIVAVLAAHDAALVAFNPATDLESAFLELTR